jgi:hypothetical protein
VRRVLLLSIAGLALLLAGCGDDDGGVVAGDDLDAPVSDEPGTDPTSGSDDPGGDDLRVVEPTPGLDGTVENAIDSASVLENDKLEVRFYNGVEDCYGLDRVEVEETATDVTVTVVTGSRPDVAGRACIEIAELVVTVVTLDAPLGERTLIDGSAGTAVTMG